MDMVVAVGTVVAQTEARTTTGLALRIRTMMLMMQTKKTEKTNVKRTKTMMISKIEGIKQRLRR
jgi:hypothetical protein